jgi:Golgi nucleoside diphosphatase
LRSITNASYVTSLLNGTRTYFSSLGLLFRSPENQVRIISGIEEGLSEWISANILMHQLYENNQATDTYGVLDMGGM